MLTIFLILAGIMALFGVLGYLYGVAAAIITLIAILGGLLLVSRLGTTLVNAINKIWQLLVSGGFQTFISGGDLSQVKEQMASVPPLIASDAAAAFLILITIIVIVIAILLGTSPRFRRPPSLLALLIGLLNGYLIGAFLLTLIFPSLLGTLPVPFFPAPANQGGVPAACCTSLWSQFVSMINNASTTSLALLVMFVVAAIIVTALIVTLRRRGSRATRRRAADGD